MGWTTMRSCGRSRLEILRELFRNSNASFTDTVLDHSIQGGTVYMLVERRPLPGAAFEPSHTYVNDPDGAFRWIAVFLTRRARDEYDFGYKDMEESMGPYEAHCPKRIIGRASPLRNTTPSENNYALDWRERCKQNRVRQAAARATRPTEGAAIRLNRPFKFTDGYEGQDFTVRYRQRRGRSCLVLESPDGGFYRVTNLSATGFTILPAAASQPSTADPPRQSA